MSGEYVGCGKTSHHNSFIVWRATELLCGLLLAFSWCNITGRRPCPVFFLGFFLSSDFIKDCDVHQYQQKQLVILAGPTQRTKYRAIFFFENIAVWYWCCWLSWVYPMLSRDKSVFHHLLRVSTKSSFWLESNERHVSTLKKIYGVFNYNRKIYSIVYYIYFILPWGNKYFLWLYQPEKYSIILL